MNVRKRLELLSFSLLFLVAILLQQFPELASWLGRLSKGFAAPMEFSTDPIAAGIFLGILMSGILVRTVIVAMMQYRIAQDGSVSIDAASKAKILLWKLAQILGACLILLLIVNTGAFQNSVRHIGERSTSLLATTLLVHIFAGAVADGAKQIVYLIGCGGR